MRAQGYAWFLPAYAANATLRAWGAYGGGGAGSRVPLLLATAATDADPDAVALCGGGPGGLAANNVTGGCRVHGSPGSLDAAVRALYGAGAPFLALLQSPGPTSVALNLTAMPPPPPGLCCGPPPVTLRKVVWSDAFTFYPPNVITMLLFARFGPSDVATLLGAAGSPLNVSAAVAAWLGAAGAAAAATWTRVLEVTSISPPHGPTSGGNTLLLRGRGFGAVPPLSAVASIGGAPCTNTTWIGDDTIACVAPGGIGLDNEVSLRVGYQSALVLATYSYDPATLYRVLTSDGRPTSTALVAGDSVLVVGANFANAVSMQCQFGGARVLAAYINDTAVTCRTPVAAAGVLDVFVTNDLVRYSNGFQFGFIAYEPVQLGGGLDVAGAGIVWTGELTDSSSTAVPADFDGTVVPPRLTIALVFTSYWASAAVAAAELALGAVRRSPRLLPFTNLTWRYYDVTPGLVDPTATTAVLGGAIADIRRDIGDEFLGIVGSAESGVCIPLANMSAAAPAPWAEVSPTATNPALSSRARFPYFLRDAPSDEFQGVALAAALQRFAGPLVQRGLMAPQALAVVVIHSDDAYSAGVTSAFVAALASTQVTVSLDVLLQLAPYAALSPSGQAAFLARILEPVCASADKTLVILLPIAMTADLLVAGYRACNLNATRCVRACVRVCVCGFLRVCACLYIHGAQVWAR